MTSMINKLLTSTAETLAKTWTEQDLRNAKEIIGERIKQLDGATTKSGKKTKSRWDSDSDEEKRHKKSKPKKTKSKQPIPSLSARFCGKIDDYELEESLNEGTYGQVWRARHRAADELVALKKVKFTANKWEGFPVAALRETNVLFELHHPNIVHAREMVLGLHGDDSYPPFDVYMAMEYFEFDLHTFMYSKLDRAFIQSEVKFLLHQLLEAIAYMHDRWYMHRDLKLTNLLYGHGGRLVVCDFGLTRQFSDPPQAYTSEVVTLFYRAPELLLHVVDYDGRGIDMWSVGCIFAELLTKTVLFQGESEPAQLDLIWHLLGTPTPEEEPRSRSWPAFAKIISQYDLTLRPQNTRRLRERVPATTPLSQGPYLTAIGMDLLEGFLVLDPSKRLQANDALKHSWFESEHPRPKVLGQMPD